MSEPHVEYDDDDEVVPDLRSCCQHAVDSYQDDRIVHKRVIREQLAQLSEQRDLIHEERLTVSALRSENYDLRKALEQLTIERDAAQNLARQLARRCDEYRRAELKEN